MLLRGRAGSGGHNFEILLLKQNKSWLVDGLEIAMVWGMGWRIGWGGGEGEGVRGCFHNRVTTFIMPNINIKKLF